MFYKRNRNANIRLNALEGRDMLGLQSASGIHLTETIQGSL